MPKISIIMPVYNAGKFLNKAVDSILSQSFSDFELIMVDDGSKDGSSERCDEFAALDPRVVVIHQKNGGICSARNTGLRIAKGEYIGFSDHDDEFLPGAFEKMLHYAETYDLDWTKVGHCTDKERQGKVLKTTIYRHAQDQTYEKGELGKHYLQLLLEAEVKDLWDSLYKADFLRTNKLFLDSSYRTGGEDIDFNGRVTACQPKFGVLSEILYKHYVHLNFSTSSKYSEHNIDVAFNFPQKLNSYLQSYNPSSIYHDQLDLYAEVIMKESISGVISSLANKNCSYTRTEKIEKLVQLRNSEAIYQEFWKISKIKFLTKNIKLGIMFALFERRLFGLCLFLSKSTKTVADMLHIQR